MGPEGFEPTTKGLWVPCATAAPQARDDFLFLFNFQFALAFGLAVARALSFPSTSKDYQSFSWSPCQQARDDFLFLFNFQFSKRSGILIYGSLGFASIHLLHFKTCHLGNFCNGVLQARDDFLFLFNFQTFSKQGLFSIIQPALL